MATHRSIDYSHVNANANYVNMLIKQLNRNTYLSTYVNMLQK